MFRPDSEDIDGVVRNADGTEFDHRPEGTWEWRETPSFLTPPRCEWPQHDLFDDYLPALFLTSDDERIDMPHMQYIRSTRHFSCILGSEKFIRRLLRTVGGKQKRDAATHSNQFCQTVIRHMQTGCPCASCVWKPTWFSTHRALSDFSDDIHLIHHHDHILADVAIASDNLDVSPLGLLCFYPKHFCGLRADLFVVYSCSWCRW
ncbi:hypothetical protein C8R48DRAFT_384924 [Suillus tomentosus]|nr:hypothetical protein C8R48DRAFT_384924 [Suillus tomentosus]